MDIGLESPVPPICFYITEFPVKIRSDRSIRIDQHPLEPSPEEGEDRRSRGWRNFSKKRKSEEERSWSSGPPVPHHLEEFSIFRLRAEDLLKLD